MRAALFFMNTTLRPAAHADLAQITAIYAHHVLHGLASFEIEPPDEVEVRRRFDAIVAGGFPYFVAEAGGRVLGYAYAGPIARGPPTAIRSKTRSTSRPTPSAAASASGCCSRSSTRASGAASARCSR